MVSCPTEAIRIKKGKAVIYEDRCVDCGECYRSCPVHAIYIKQDDFEKIHMFSHKIALVPHVFFGQFPSQFTQNDIKNAILGAGFTDVVEVEQSVPFLIEQINKYVKKHAEDKPIISSFCPAIVRLIQVKFPSLTSNILLLKPPLDITAYNTRKRLVDQGIDNSDIGLFYITPCAAKIAAIKSPVGEEESQIDGVINMDTLFNRTFTYLSNNKNKMEINREYSKLNFRSRRWPLTEGESKYIKGNNFAIDGIHNVIDFLEKIEDDEVPGVDYLELRACIESCVGGVLLTTNKFLIAERIKNNNDEPEVIKVQNFIHDKEYLESHIAVNKVEPRNIMSLDDNIEKAMQKLTTISDLMKILPQTDCSACGAPNCNALANDIANNESTIEQCIFIQKNMEAENKLKPEESYEILSDIWGKNKFSKYKNLKK
jgi:iron only hydrogenase large subunit-like protein